MRPDLVGCAIMQITDNNGKSISRRCKAGSQSGGGWVDYVWTKPGDGKVFA